MTPNQVSSHLRKMAAYLESGKPDRQRIMTGLKQVIGRLQVSADVRQFTQDEFNEALHGMNALISRLQKIVKSTNPQDPVRAELESKVTAFTQAKELLEQEYDSLNAQV